MTAKPYGPMAPDGSQYITLTDGNGNLVTSLAPSGAAGGDLAGTYPNPTITNAPVIAKVLTGYVSGSGTVSASDTILSAIQKLNGNDALKQSLAGTTTNDNASAGNIGEYRSADTGAGVVPSTVTITIASPAVITWGITSPFTFNGNGTCVVNFSTTGALPTGIVVGTNYYVIGSSVSGNTFQIATSVDNAIAGTAINTSGSQSGTHTGTPDALLTTSTTADIVALSLTAGDWDVSVDLGLLPTASTSVTIIKAGVSLVSATQSLLPGRITQIASSAQVPTVNMILHAGPVRMSLNATTTIYGIAQGVFTVSTLSGWGGIRARRVR